MNKPFYIFLFLFTLNLLQSKTCIAQTNLIYNGDFELYDTCPVTISSPSTYQIETCLGWKSPTYATSDYYNSCSTWPVSIPQNTFGYQVPYSGNAYCGILFEYVAPPYGTYGYWFEYIQGNLNSQLKLGYEYEFSCRVVLSDLGWDYALWKFGAVFSPSAISKSDGKPFYGYTPLVINNTNSFITDTINWVEIKGKFISQGNEQFVTLGFFSDTISLDTLRLFNPFAPDPNHFANYYFIDDCRLIETGNIYEYPNIFSPNDDGENDEWNPSLQDGESIDIFNRWGIKVFEVSKMKQTWDGRTTSGIECVDGVYFFVVNNGAKETNNIAKKGFVQLLR